jgi:hypothetical protein
MILKIIYNNRFYFWLLFISMTFISYLSIYESLVIHRTYSLIPVYFLSYISLFSLLQLLSMLLIIAILSKFKLNQINNQQALKILAIRRNVGSIYCLGLFFFITINFF